MRSSSRPSGTASESLKPAPYMVGVAMAANALPGIAFDVACDQGELEDALALLAGHDDTSPFPRDPGHRIRVAGDEHAHDSSMHSVNVPLSTDGDDWVAGYRAALSAVARTLPLPPGGAPDSNRVVVVGGLMDRLEPDAMADLDELRRILEGLGFDVGDSWPCGKGPDSLSRAAGAGILVSLPYGREAARLLAARTGAMLVEAPLPLGLPGTLAFIESVAAATGRESAAGSFVDGELERMIPDLQWLVPHSLLHRRIGVAGDGPVVKALVQYLQELGCHVSVIAVTGAPGECPEVSSSSTPGTGLDLCIGPTPVFQASFRAGMASLEFGFPSIGSHPIHGVPRLGFKGAASLIEGVTERMVRITAVKDWIRMLEGDSTAVRPEEVRNRQEPGGASTDPAGQQKGPLGKGHS